MRMTRVTVDITTSLDGFVAGPRATLEHPLGEGGEQLHEWAFATAAFRAQHGGEGGEESEDSRLIAEGLARTGAVVMGRRMFSGGEGPWADDPNANGWWGDDPPFHVPVYVLTHHAREPLVMQGGTTFHFVTDGSGSALEQARAAAGERDVAIAGGASAVQQYVRAGVVDELQVHVAPLLLGDGVPLFGSLGVEPLRLEATRVAASPAATHLRFSLPLRGGRS
jgi:dihydrofolate reductase